jgi:magnesium and cobalt transporter
VPVTEEDLLFMLRLAHRHAQLPREARHVIESVLRFQQATARQIMVPRPRVETVDASWDDTRLREAVGQSPHSRFPVVDGSPDRIVGVLHARHLLRLEPGTRWTATVVDPIYIPESKQLPDLLQDMRQGGQHLAIVLDEFGGFSGVVCLEDILELVFGEIEDELDRELGTTVVAEGDGWLVPGYLALRRLERILHRSLPAPEGVDSVGGLVGSLVETEVAAGDVVHWEGLALEVREVDSGRATLLRVKPAPLG